MLPEIRMPQKVHELELTRGVSSVGGMNHYDALHVLIRYMGQPLGWVTVTNGDHKPAVTAESLQHEIKEQLGYELLWRLFANCDSRMNGHKPTALPISIIVCTRDRSDQLATCLKSLTAIEYPRYEIIIVDNAPSDDQTALLVKNYPVRYIRENRPGIGYARNCGISCAQYDLIAFTDDDVSVDRLWLQALNSAFCDPAVMVVTGLIVPQELETEAQIQHEFGYGGFMSSMKQKSFRGKQVPLRDLLWASSFGAGANMALRRQVFADVGLFDTALGVGTPSRSGEDIEMFHRIVSAGYTLLYEPNVIVWHRHRREMAAFSRQLHNNGAGFGSYLLTCARNGSVSYLKMLNFALREWIGWWMTRRLLRPHSFPRRLIISELLGALTSPFHYLAAQVKTKKMDLKTRTNGRNSQDPPAP